MTPGAEAEVRRWMKQVLGYIRSLTWAMWSEHELSCSIEVNNVRIGGQDSVCNNPSLFIYTHSGLNTDTVNDLIVSVCNVQCGEGIQSKTKVWKIPHFQKITKNKIKVVCKLHFKPFKCCSWVPHLALLRDPVECDEDGEVGGADLGLGHALCHGAGDVDPAQPLHGVQVPIAS